MSLIRSSFNLVNLTSLHHIVKRVKQASKLSLMHILIEKNILQQMKIDIFVLFIFLFSIFLHTVQDVHV